MTLQILQEGRVIFTLELRDDDRLTKIDFVEQLVSFITNYKSTSVNSINLAMPLPINES